MKYTEVEIRPVDYIKNQGDDIYKLFTHLQTESIQLICEYTEKGYALSPPPCKIGDVVNTRIKNGYFVCDIIVHDLIKLANNFTGKIDSYRVRVSKKDDGKKIFEPICFIIYSKK